VRGGMRPLHTCHMPVSPIAVEANKRPPHVTQTPDRMNGHGKGGNEIPRVLLARRGELRIQRERKAEEAAYRNLAKRLLS
jgi:hypothetical protein